MTAVNSEFAESEAGINESVATAKQLLDVIVLDIAVEHTRKEKRRPKKGPRFLAVFLMTALLSVTARNTAIYPTGT